MQEIVRIKAVAGSNYVGDWRTIAKQILEPLSPIEIEESPFGYDFLFDYFPAQTEEIVNQLKTQGFTSNFYVRRHYTEQERLSAEYLKLGYEGLVDSVEGTLTRHIAPICLLCGYQEREWNFTQLQIGQNGQGYRLAAVDWHARVMSRALAEALRDIHVTGLKLEPVGGDEAAQWYGFTSTHTLPPLLSPPTRLTLRLYRTENCAFNHGFGSVYSELFYKKENFNAVDFNRTYELWGDKERGVRSIVISNRVYRLLVKLGVEQLKCEPIRFVE